MYICSMRFKKQQKTHKEGDIRIKKLFLWWPVTIKGETRWLEWALIKQEYVMTYEYDGFLIVLSDMHWVDVSFENEKKLSR